MLGSMRCGRRLSKGKVDERANESGTHSVVRYGTSSSFYRCESVSSAATVALAVVAWRALGHLGWVPCTARFGARTDPGYSTDQGFTSGEVGSGAEGGCPASTLAIFDTYRIRAPYVGEIGAGDLFARRLTLFSARYARRHTGRRTPIGLCSTRSTFATRPCAVRFRSSFRSTLPSRSLA